MHESTLLRIENPRNQSGKNGTALLPSTSTDSQVCRLSEALKSRRMRILERTVNTLKGYVNNGAPGIDLDALNALIEEMKRDRHAFRRAPVPLYDLVVEVLETHFCLMKPRRHKSFHFEAITRDPHGLAANVPENIRRFERGELTPFQFRFRIRPRAADHLLAPLHDFDNDLPRLN